VTVGWKNLQLLLNRSARIKGRTSAAGARATPIVHNATVVGRDPEMVFCSMLGALASFLIGIVDPRVLNKAGPDWLWMGGRHDAIRNLYFNPNGSFRRYGRAALFVTLVAGTTAFVWMLHPLM
jgi:hypothetical protein